MSFEYFFGISTKILEVLFLNIEIFFTVVHTLKEFMVEKLQQFLINKTYAATKYNFIRNVKHKLIFYFNGKLFNL